MTGGGTDKVERILGIYTKLINGAVVNKTQEAYIYKVNERSIQRDIDDIRNYLDQEAVEQGFVNQVVYDRKEKGYRLEHVCKSKITSDEVLAISKILLNSRAFPEDMKIDETSKNDKKTYSTIYRMDRIKSLKVLNERFHIPYKDRFEYGEFKKKG